MQLALTLSLGLALLAHTAGAQQLYVVDSNQKILGEYGGVGIALWEGATGIYAVQLDPSFPSGFYYEPGDTYFAGPNCTGQTYGDYEAVPRPVLVFGTDLRAGNAAPQLVSFQSRGRFPATCVAGGGQQMLYAVEVVAKTTDWVPPFSLVRIPAQPVSILPR